VGSALGAPTFARTTATYGRPIAPAANTNCHHPVVTSISTRHTTRTLIAIVYLSIRDRRSASGDGGSEVMDGCFIHSKTTLVFVPPAGLTIHLRDVEPLGFPSPPEGRHAPL